MILKTRLHVLLGTIGAVLKTRMEAILATIGVVAFFGAFAYVIVRWGVNGMLIFAVANLVFYTFLRVVFSAINDNAFNNKVYDAGLNIIPVIGALIPLLLKIVWWGLVVFVVFVLVMLFVVRVLGVA